MMEYLHENKPMQMMAIKSLKGESYFFALEKVEKIEQRFNITCTFGTMRGTGAEETMRNKGISIVSFYPKDSSKALTFQVCIERFDERKELVDKEYHGVKYQLRRIDFQMTIKSKIEEREI